MTGADLRRRAINGQPASLWCEHAASRGSVHPLARFREGRPWTCWPRRWRDGVSNN